MLTGRVVRGDLEMTGEVTLSGQVLAAGGIAERLLAAHRCGLAGVILPRGNEREVDEELRRTVAVHYVTRVNELLELATVVGRAGSPGCRGVRSAWSSASSSETDLNRLAFTFLQ